MNGSDYLHAIPAHKTTIMFVMSVMFVMFVLQMEMERQRSRFKDEITLMATENEELQSRIEELKGEIVSCLLT